MIVHAGPMIVQIRVNTYLKQHSALSWVDHNHEELASCGNLFMVVAEKKKEKKKKKELFLAGASVTALLQHCTTLGITMACAAINNNTPKKEVGHTIITYKK